MKLVINNRRKTGKYTNMWKLNNTLLKNQWTREQIKRKIKKYLKTNKNRNTICHLTTITSNYNKESSKREVYSDKHLHKVKKKELK